MVSVLCIRSENTDPRANRPSGTRRCGTIIWNCGAIASQRSHQARRPRPASITQTADHIDDLELPHEVRAQIMEGYPSGQRTGLPAPAATKGFDYLHMNAASPIPESAGHTDPRFKPGNVIVSYRYINTLAVVDRDTTKIVWKTVGLTIGQHNPHFVPEGLPGTRNLLVFDNGYVDGNTNPYRASTRPYSRVLEINPLDKSIVWEYTAENRNRPIWTLLSQYIYFPRSKGGRELAEALSAVIASS